MGLFSVFSKKENVIVQSMKDYLGKYMVKYASQNHEDMPNVAGIFANTRIMLNSLTDKIVKQELRSSGMCAECAVLNIIQNNAMTEIEPTKNWVFGLSDGGAFDLYMAVNEEKFNLGYIDFGQYQENKLLGQCLRKGHRPII